MCDGSGACRKYISGTACGPNLCSGSTLTGQQCDGLGTCASGQTTSCDPFLCAGTSCAVSCADDAGCVATAYCGNNVCLPKVDNAATCTSDHECKSGFCVEGLCCNTACDGVCQACTQANKVSGADGVCGDAKDGVDPHGDCQDEGQSSCKHDGQCDGAGACRLYPNGAACGESGPFCLAGLACVGFANLHNWSFSEDGGGTASLFVNGSNFHYCADVAIDGQGNGEGGLRFAPSAREGAADPDGQVYGTRGVYAFDSSGFPSSASSHTMAPIIAVAHHLAARLEARSKR